MHQSLDLVVNIACGQIFPDEYDASQDHMAPAITRNGRGKEPKTRYDVASRVRFIDALERLRDPPQPRLVCNYAGFDDAQERVEVFLTLRLNCVNERRPLWEWRRSVNCPLMPQAIDNGV